MHPTKPPPSGLRVFLQDLPHDEMADPEKRRRFVQEAQAARRSTIVTVAT